jgi:hypothetical protein
MGMLAFSLGPFQYCHFSWSILCDPSKRILAFLGALAPTPIWAFTKTETKENRRTKIFFIRLIFTAKPQRR